MQYYVRSVQKAAPVLNPDIFLQKRFLSLPLCVCVRRHCGVPGGKKAESIFRPLINKKP